MKNISDFAFCLEFVKRLYKLDGRMTRTKNQLFNIVIRNKPVEISEMFKDSDIDELEIYEGMYKFVYSFVRDNQNLFIDN